MHIESKRGNPKNQADGTDRPILTAYSNFTAKPANLKVYHKAPLTLFLYGAFTGGFADTFLCVGHYTKRP